MAIKRKESCQGDARVNAYGREEIRIGQRGKEVIKPQGRLQLIPG